MEYKNKFEYIRNLFAVETAQLINIRRNTADKNDHIYIYPEEGKLLQLLIKLANIKTIIELGTLSGYSSTWMVGALPADGRIYSFERDPKRAEISLKNITDPRISVIIGNALETLPAIEDQGPFDMIFIDADKLNYTNYLDWAEKNIRRGGLIIGDNTLLFDAVWNPNPERTSRPGAVKSMKEFNRRLADPEKYTGVMIPTEEGLTVAIKNF